MENDMGKAFSKIIDKITFPCHISQVLHLMFSVWCSNFEWLSLFSAFDLITFCHYLYMDIYCCIHWEPVFDCVVLIISCFLFLFSFNNRAGTYEHNVPRNRKVAYHGTFGGPQLLKIPPTDGYLMPEDCKGTTQKSRLMTYKEKRKFAIREAYLSLYFWGGESLFLWTIKRHFSSLRGAAIFWTT